MENVAHKYQERFYLSFSLARFTGHQMSQGLLQRSVPLAKGYSKALRAGVCLYVYIHEHTPSPHTASQPSTVCTAMAGVVLSI